MSRNLADRRILVADVDAARARAITGMLAGAGAIVEVASALHEALDLLEEADPAFDGVILGERLADSEGVVLARAVRTSPVLFDLRLVMLATGALPEGIDVACPWPAPAESLAAAILDPPPQRMAAPATEDPVLDLSELESIAGGMTPELTAMLRRFAGQAQKMATDATAAAQAGDAQAAKHLAHALKGAAFSAGAMRLGRAAQAFEDAALAADWDTAAATDLSGESKALAEAILSIPEP